MSRFNFSNVLGGAVFGGLNAFLQHNASRDGYAKQNRYEVVILLPAGVSGASARPQRQLRLQVAALLPAAFRQPRPQ